MNICKLMHLTTHSYWEGRGRERGGGKERMRIFYSCRYVRCLGAVYLRLVGETLEVYNYLEPLYNDYRKIKRKNRNGPEVPYSRKYWWELNLAVEPPIAIARILADLVRYGITINVVIPQP